MRRSLSRRQIPVILTFLLAVCLLCGCGRPPEIKQKIADIHVLQGAEQTAFPHSPYEKELTVEVLSAPGTNALGWKTMPAPVANTEVLFSAEEGSDLKIEPDHLKTDDSGVASVKLTGGAKVGDHYIRILTAENPEVSRLVRVIVGSQVTGNAQEGSANKYLHQPITVKLVNPDGKPAQNVPVYFSVLAGPDKSKPAVLEHPVARTDAEGAAVTRVKLGGGTGSTELGIEVSDPNHGYYIRQSRVHLLGLDLTGVIIATFGGLAFFIFGMKLMGDGLLKVSGENMKKILQFFSRNRFVAILAGTVVTAIIQASGATTVMVIGFINAGLLTLKQAIGIIFGANIGTTVTAQIIALNLNSLSLPCIVIGFLMTVVTKKRLVRGWGEAVLGFGLLFYGMTMMSSELKVLGTFPTFIHACGIFDCAPQIAGGFMPFGSVLGAILIGAVVTFIIQSSSAAVGIILALASGGLINFYTAVPLLLGTNIGTTLTAVLASLAANRVAKQAALAHFMFNIIGTAFMVILCYIPYGEQRIPCFLYFVNSITPGDAFSPNPHGIEQHIAMAHTCFNVLTVAILTPFIGAFARMCEKMLPIRDVSTVKTSSLEPLLLSTPSVAIDQVIFELRKMVTLSWQMVNTAVNDHFIKINTDPESFRILEESEAQVDAMQTAITNYLVQITRRELTQHQSSLIPLLMHCTNDAERIADHTETILKLTKRLAKTGARLSDIAVKDLNKMFAVLQSQAENVALALGSASDKSSIESALESEKRINKMAKKYHKTFTRKKEAGFYDDKGGVDRDADQDEPFADSALADGAEDAVTAIALENEHEINQLAKQYEQEHIDRRNSGLCAVEPSVIFIEMLSELERIGDHLANIAVRTPEIQKHYFSI